MSANTGIPPISSVVPDRDELKRINTICRRFILASFIFFLISTIMGYLMLSRLIPSAPSFVHAHVGVYGWITLLIFGVAYKLLPSAFANKTRVHSLRMAEVHFWMAMVGLSGLFLFEYLSRFRVSSLYFHAGVIFGAFLLASGVIFVVNMWKTFMQGQENSPQGKGPAQT